MGRIANGVSKIAKVGSYNTNKEMSVNLHGHVMYMDSFKMLSKLLEECSGGTFENVSSFVYT